MNDWERFHQNLQEAMKPIIDRLYQFNIKYMEEHMNIEDIAVVCHEANRAYCQGLGDFSQKPWDESPAWQRQSAITGVEFNLKNPAAPASASHDSWLEEKTRDGWKYGPVKDPEKKEHPCYVPYTDLPLEQQAKDHLFKNIVAALRPLVMPAEQALKGCSCDPGKGEVCELCDRTATKVIEEMREYVTDFIDKRFPHGLGNPALHGIMCEVVLDAFHDGARWQEGQAKEESRIITNV